VIFSRNDPFWKYADDGNVGSKRDAAVRLDAGEADDSFSMVQKTWT
jgi:hypothetical protein